MSTQPLRQEYSEIKARIHHYLISKTDFLMVKDKLNDDQLRMFVDRAITDMCRQSDLTITIEDRHSLIRELVSAVVSLGPIRDLMDDETITEIMINGYKQVFIQRAGKIYLTDVKFRDNMHLHNTAQRMLAASESNKRVDESQPYVDFSLPDGSRVNIILPPCTLQGPVVTIRKFKKDIGTVEHLLSLGTINKEIALLLIAAVKGMLNVVFCGSTGSGKTTLLNVISRHIPEEERIITIEDTAELRLHQEHVVNLQAKDANIEGKGAITTRDLFKNSLRMRPDRIIVGEVRGEEILDMIQSIASGHSGTLSIIHADSPDECFNRMTTMMMMSGIALDTKEIQRQIASAIDLIVYIELLSDGVRRVLNVTDLRYDKQTKEITMEDIFTFDQKQVTETGKVIGDWTHHKQKPSFVNKLLKYNVRLPKGFYND